MTGIKNNDTKSVQEKIEVMLDWLNEFTLVDVDILINAIKDKFNITEAVVSSNTSGNEAEKEEEKQDFSNVKVSVKLTSAGKDDKGNENGSKKMEIYKFIKSVYKEVKGEETSLVLISKSATSEDKIILKDIAKDKAEKIIEEIKKIGGDAVLQ